MSGVTVVIPVWGSYCAKLPACVADARAQDADVELLVVDNASDVPLPPLPPDVRTLRLPERLTVGAARNAALAAVRTPYVLFADADDRLLPGAVAHLASKLDADAGLVAAVGGQVRWNVLTDEPLAGAPSPRPLVAAFGRVPRLLALCTLRFNVFPLVGCAVLRLEAVRASGGFGDGNLGEDWELGAALTWRGRIAFSRRACRLYAVEEGSLWHRAHPRASIEAQHARFRDRLYLDAAVPRWARATRALFAALQRRDAARMCRDGAYHPGALRARRAATARKGEARPVGSAHASSAPARERVAPRSRHAGSRL